jgi:hypothetical protein
MNMKLAKILLAISLYAVAAHIIKRRWLSLSKLAATVGINVPKSNKYTKLHGDIKPGKDKKPMGKSFFQRTTKKATPKAKAPMAKAPKVNRASVVSKFKAIISSKLLARPKYRKLAADEPGSTPGQLKPKSSQSSGRTNAHFDPFHLLQSSTPLKSNERNAKFILDDLKKYELQRKGHSNVESDIDGLSVASSDSSSSLYNDEPRRHLNPASSKNQDGSLNVASDSDSVSTHSSDLAHSVASDSDSFSTRSSDLASSVTSSLDLAGKPKSGDGIPRLETVKEE